MPRLSSAMLIFTLWLAATASAQVVVNPAATVALTNRDTRAVTIAAGSTATIAIAADPSAAGGDFFDIVATDPAVTIALVLPSGVEINESNAEALGATWGVLADGSLSRLSIASALSTPGTHTVVTLPSGSAPGTYRIRAAAAGVAVDTLIVASYFSTSTVRAGLLTEAPVYRVGDTVVLSGFVFDGPAAVTQASAVVGISVTSNLAAPSAQVTLQDSGPFDDRTGDGVYTGEFTAATAGSFAATLRVTGFSTAGVPFTRTATTTFRVLPPLARIGALADAGVDDDFNQLIDRVVVTANLDVQTAGHYQFGLTLQAANGAEIKASTAGALDAGAGQLQVSFAAEDLRRLGGDGPYALANAALTYRDDPDVPLVDFRESAGSTAAYLLSSLEQGALFADGLNAPPTIDAVSDLMADATSPQGAVVTFDLPGAVDAVDLAPNVSTAPRSGSIFPIGVTTVTVTATNASGNSSTATFTVTVRYTGPPTLTVPADMTLEATGPGGAVATFAPTASDVVDVTDPVTCTPASGSTFPLGATTVTCEATNAAGHTATKTFTVAVHDTTAPVIRCGTADTVWHRADVAIACTADDAGAGLASASDAAFSLSTAVPANSETASASTGTRTVCDLAGNCATAGPIGGIRVDRKAPQIALVAPADTTYAIFQAVAASYTCSDNGALVATCAGSKSNGANIDTATLGTHTFTVTSTDAAGNASTVSRSYHVSIGGVLTSVSPASLWLGLKNSDDAGTRFDLLVEIVKDGAVVATGELDNVAGGGSGFNNAMLRAIAVALNAPVPYFAGDTAGVRVSVRIASTSSHRSGTARLWFNGSSANSRITVTVSGFTHPLYLSGGLALTVVPASGAKTYVDVFVDRLAGGNAFKPFGTWSVRF